MVAQDRSRYVGGAEGAPPLPPPGGYRGARRAPEPAASNIATTAGAVTYTAPEPPARPPGALSILAVCLAFLFLVVLLIVAAVGGADALYGTTMLVLQLLVLGVMIAALFTRRGRVLAASALAVTLLLNTWTVGAMGAMYAAANHDYDGTKSVEQRHAEAHPGIRDMSMREVLDQPSLEQAQALGAEIMAEIRARLSAEFGFTWVSTGGEDIGPERNGYGGESMLRRYVSTVWTSEQPVRSVTLKRQVMAVVEQVIGEYGLWGLYAFNEPGSVITDDMRARLYGSTDPALQHTWEYYGDDYPDPLRFYAMAYDLGNDPSGQFFIQREAQNAQTGEPLEGIQLVIFARRLLSEADREEFIERMADYPAF